MAITPDTDIRLLKLPLEIDNKNQLTFTNLAAQTTYFTGLQALEYNSCQYQRKDSIMNIPAHIDSILEYNYVMYKNDNYGNKWFYAFIVGMEYVNDGLTKVQIQTDVWQTWQFDLTWKQSFVEREMINVADDTIGKNRLVEGLETGEYIIKTSYNIDNLDGYYIIAYVGDTIKRESGGDLTVNQHGYKYNGVYSSVTFILCNETGFNYIMGLMAYEDNSNNILTVFTVPKIAVNPQQEPSWVSNGYLILNDNYYTTPTYLNNINALTLNDDFEGYTPKNKKLLQYPYTYLGFNPVERN